MTAILKTVGPLKLYVNNQAEVNVSAGRTVRETLKGAGIPPELVALVLVNGECEDKDYVVRDGDAIKVIAVIGGG